MKNFKDIKNRIRKVYWRVISKRNKRLFKRDKIAIYQYMDEIFCNGKESFDAVVNKYSGNVKEYWNCQNIYSLSDYFPDRHTNSGKMIFDNFLKLYKEKPILMDVGCASGEWTLRMASECKEIDGFEYSQNLVDTANEIGRTIENAHFYQADAKNMKLDKKYDGALIQGMLMYLDEENDIFKVLENVYKNLKPGAYLCTRDTLNQENKKVIFLYNKKNGYNGVYWNQKIYYEQFFKAGFILKEEILLDEVKTRRLDFIARGAIWQKPNK